MYFVKQTEIQSSEWDAEKFYFSKDSSSKPTRFFKKPFEGNHDVARKQSSARVNKRSYSRWGV